MAILRNFTHTFLFFAPTAGSLVLWTSWEVPATSWGVPGSSSDLLADPGELPGDPRNLPGGAKGSQEDPGSLLGGSLEHPWSLPRLKLVQISAKMIY